MYWLLTSLTLAAEPKNLKQIYVAPPTIHDEALRNYQPYINSLLVSASNTNTHWVKKAHKADQVHIYDKHTISYALDTTCDYRRPLECANDNGHWALVTDIFTTENFATIVVKLYDENIQLLATASKSSYSIEKCKEQIKNTTVESQSALGQSNTEITEKLPDKCVMLKPAILDKDIKQAITIMFASVHPIQ